MLQRRWSWTPFYIWTSGPRMPTLSILYEFIAPPGPSFTGLSLGEYLSIPRHGAFRPDLSATNQHLRSPSFAQASFLISSPHDDGFDLIRCRFVLKARGAGRTSSKRKNKGNVPLAYYKVLRATSMHWSVEKYTQIFNIPLSLWLESSLKNF